MRPKTKAPIRTTQPEPTRRSTRQQTQTNTGSESWRIYKEMLVDAEIDDHLRSYSLSRPTKRRKISEEPDDNTEPLFDEPILPSVLVDPPTEEGRPQQIVFDDFEDSDESDAEFEDVDLSAVDIEVRSEDDTMPEQKPLQLDLTKSIEQTPKRATTRRKPLTRAERDLCLDVHKWHLLSLFGHQLARNVWCEREEIHAILKPLVSRKVIALLHVDESQPAYQRNHSFMKGIEEICAIWQHAWTINARGLRRAYWTASVDAVEAFDDAEDSIDFDDFKKAAHIRTGSRDLGAQLFCALLRAVAVDTRLVFSMQVLPYSGEVKPTQSSTPNKSQYIQAPAQSYGSTLKKKPKTKKLVDSPYPIFWVEVFNPATTTWIPLDPVVRNTINKPKTQFEPPASDHLNSITYVIAFEEDNTARDVTRRYTQWFNAKTRKLRVESTKGGEEWWSKAMRVFRRSIPLPRDDVEETQLLQRLAAEGLPKNVEDFRRHPVYVLERHIKRNEVVHPKREVGKFTTGTAKSSKLESVFRRQDLHVCRSADAWYRRGRDVKTGEQPLERVMPTKRGTRAVSEDDENEEERDGVALYAEFQTQIYEPPPVIDGRIPKNAFGNLDVYVLSMIPAGAVHIMHPLASQAAKLLNVDFTEAVTGFSFKGRQGTAVINGCVVATEYTAAVTATIEGLERQGTQEVQEERSRIILSAWKRLLTALRVRERIENDYGKRASEDDANGDSDDGSNFSEDSGDDDEEDAGGGFMLEADETVEKANEQLISMQKLKNKTPFVLPDEVVHQPIKVVRSPHKAPEAVAVSKKEPAIERFDSLFADDDQAGGFMPDVDDSLDGDGGGFVVDDTEQHDDGGFNEDGSGQHGGGGFVPDVEVDGDSEDGRFVRDNDDEELGGNIVPEGLTATPASHPTPQPPSRTIPDISAHTRPAPANPTTTMNPPDWGNVSTNGPLLQNSTEGIVLDDESVRDSDETSLLSHDPAEDEDDAVPDWLDDALE